MQGTPSAQVFFHLAPCRRRRTAAAALVKILLLISACTVPACFAVLKLAVAFRGDSSLDRAGATDHVVAILRDTQEGKAPNLASAVAAIEKGYDRELWDRGDYRSFLEELPDPQETWSNERLLEASELVVRVLAAGDLTDFRVLDRASRVLRRLRHLLVLKDLADPSDAAGNRTRFLRVLADEDERLSTHLVRTLLSVYARVERICRGAQGPLSRGARPLLEELAGFSMLIDRPREAVDRLLLEPGEGQAVHPAEDEFHLLDRYRWISLLEAAGEHAARAMAGEKARLQGAVLPGPEGLIVRLGFSAISDYHRGDTRRSYVRARRVLRELGLVEGPIPLAVARFSAFVALRSALTEAHKDGYDASGPPKPAGPRAIKLLIDLGRLYAELGDEGTLPVVVTDLRRSFGSDPRAAYGVRLLDAARSGDRSALRRILSEESAQGILARPWWEAFASGTSAQRPQQEILFDIARVWDALAEPERVAETLLALKESGGGEASTAYEYYVEAIYLVARGHWGHAEKVLERLQALLQDYRRKHGEEMPALSLPSVAPLYRLVWQKRREREKLQFYLHEAEQLYDRLLVPPAYTDDPAPAFAAGMTLARAYLRRGRFGRANAALTKIAPVWREWSRRGPPILLEREFIALVDAIRDSLQKLTVTLAVRNNATLFTEGEQLLAHLRQFVGDPKTSKRQEAHLCQWEAKRIEQGIESLPVEAEERRQELTARKRSLYLRAAQCAEGINADPFWSGKLFLMGGDHQKAVPLLQDALASGRTDAGDEILAAYLLGEAFRKAGDPRSAIRVFARLTGWGTSEEGPDPRDLHQPEHYKAFLGLGLSLMALKRYREADRAFAFIDRVLGDESEGWRKAFFYRAKAKLLAGSGEKLDASALREAIALFDEFIRWPRGLKIQEPDGSGVYLVDWAMIHLGEARRLTARRPAELKKAAEPFRRLAERYGQSESRLTTAQKCVLRGCWWNIAEILFELRQWTRAKEYYRKVGRVFRTSPLSVWAYYQLGRCSEQAGDGVEAEAFYRHGQELLAGFTETELAQALPGSERVRDFWNERFQLRLDRLALE